MEIAELPPDLSFPRLAETPEDLSFSFELKRAAIGPHVARKWGWDDDYQMAVHRRHLAEKPFLAIRRDGERIGTVSLSATEAFVRFGEFYLSPDRHRSGLGTRILKHCLAAADAVGLPVRLEYLKWNPVGSLYKRHGFEVVGETDFHWLMERPFHDVGTHNLGR
jgi:GNAT superfamily N-acetyltransferase